MRWPPKAEASESGPHRFELVLSSVPNVVLTCHVSPVVRGDVATSHPLLLLAYLGGMGRMTVDLARTGLVRSGEPISRPAR